VIFKSFLQVFLSSNSWVGGCRADVSGAQHNHHMGLRLTFWYSLDVVLCRVNVLGSTGVLLKGTESGV
jgi:hypothetical protein